MMSTSFVHRVIDPLERSITQKNPGNISIEYTKLETSFGIGSLLPSIFSTYAEQFPQAASFYPRLRQMSSITSCQCNFSLQEKIAIGLFINTVIHSEQRTGKQRTIDEHFERNHNPFLPLPCRLQYITDKQSTYAAIKISDTMNEQRLVVRIPDDASIPPTICHDTLSSLYVLKPSKRPPFFPELKARIVQLNQIDFLAYGILFDKCCYDLSLFIEAVILQYKPTKSIHFKKRLYKETENLSYSALYSPKTASTYLFLKKAARQILYQTCGSKKASIALRIPDDRNISPTLVVQAVNRKVKHYEELSDEASFYKKISGNKGIWPLLCSAKYRQIIKNIEGDPKVALFSELGRSGREIFKNPSLLTIDQHLQIGEHLAAGVHYLHSRKAIHADLHPGNFLFSPLPNSQITAGLIDFGFSFFMSEGMNSLSYLEDGFYGSINPTAPELLSNSNFTGDLYKVEIWALGFLLYSLFLGERPSWSHFLETHWEREKDAPVKEELKDKIIQEIKTSILLPRRSLLEKKNRSIEDDYLLLIYDMLELDPEKRLDSLTVTQRIGVIQVNRLAEIVNTTLHLQMKQDSQRETDLISFKKSDN